MLWLNNLLNEWATWFAVTAGLAGILGWAVGLPAVLRIMAAFAEIVAPLGRAITSATVAVLGWTWRTMIWPANPKQPSIRRGVTDITDDWVTILCAILLAWAAYKMGGWQVDTLTDNLSACQSEIVKLKRSYSAPAKDWLLWPLW